MLGHVVRGGRPSAFDRLLASRLARVAVESLLRGETSKMAAWMQAREMPAGVSVRRSRAPAASGADRVPPSTRGDRPACRNM